MQQLGPTPVADTNPVAYSLIESQGNPNTLLDFSNESDVTVKLIVGGRPYLQAPNSTVRYPLTGDETVVTVTAQSAPTSSSSFNGMIYALQDLSPEVIARGANAADILPITSGDIQDGAVTTAKVANTAITTALMAPGAVTSGVLANLAVSSGKLADAAVATAKLADGSVATSKIQNAAITTALIANAAITTALIANAAITTALIANAAIQNVNIASGTITVESLTVTAGTGDNAVVNPGAEDSLNSNPNQPAAWQLSGWEGNYSGASVSNNPFSIISGSKAFVLTLAVGGAGHQMSIASPAFPVVPGDVWYFSAKAKAQAATLTGAYFRVCWGTTQNFQRNDAGVGFNDILGNAGLPTITSLIEGQVTIPAGASWCRVTLYLWEPNIATSIEFDDIVARKVITTQQVGGISADKITAGTITATISINGPTITGGLIRTAASGPRVEINANTYKAINLYSGVAGETGPASISIDNVTGNLDIKGNASASYGGTSITLPSALVSPSWPSVTATPSPLTLSGGWVTYPGFTVPRYSSILGVTALSGLIKDGSWTAGTVIASGLPIPTGTIILWAIAFAAGTPGVDCMVRLDINTSGQLTYSGEYVGVAPTSGSGHWLSLTGITYPAWA